MAKHLFYRTKRIEMYLKRIATILIIHRSCMTGVMMDKLRISSRGAILFAVTDDAKLALSYYQFFKTDYVSRWGENWEMSEYEVHAWLRAVGGC